MQVFEFIRGAFRRDHRPPTVREIAEHFGFRSPKAVSDHLNALERKGYISRSRRKARNIEMRKEFTPDGIPIVGRIAAGSPILAVENLEGSLSLESTFGPQESTFAVRVSGESMSGAGILDGDYVIVQAGAKVREGAVGVVLAGEEATVKRVHYEGEFIRLKAENPDFGDRLLSTRDPEVKICGPVRGVVRRL